MRVLRLLLLTLSLCVIPGAAMATPACDTSFVNPFSSVEWSCMYPIRFAGMSISPSGPDPESKVDTILCSCKDGAFQRIGVAIGFREPSRLLDVAKPAWCLVSLGLDMGNESIWGDGGAISSPGGAGGNIRDYYAHTHYYYFNPLLILQLLLDFSCLEKMPLDIAYMSELDPFAQSDELALFAFPETILFSNPAAILACAADAIAATGGISIDALFWCAGSWGSVYPISGRATGAEGNWVTSSALVAAKYLARSHRELISWGTKGDAAMCGPYPQPIWQKSQYKFQMVQPVKMRSCIPIGRSGLLWDFGKNPAVPGTTDNFSYIVWRYRDCCSF